nr:ribonuclease H-like domain, Gag-pre-integrase domain protein [Tanacetum cinerariifolium]
MRTKLEVDTLSFDDLYNNLRVFTSDVKGSTASFSSTHNVAFISSDSTNSTNEVSITYGVSTSSGHNSQKEGSSSYTDDLINSGSDTKVTSCLKVFEESYAKLKKLYDEQREKLGDASIEIQAYTLALKKKLLAEAEKEKEELKTKLDNFQSSSKGLSKLLNSQMSAKDKSKIGDVEDSPVNDRFAKVEGMHVVPPPMTGIYMPPKFNFGIDESKFTYGPKQFKTSKSDVKTNDVAFCESNSSVETLESEYESDSDDEYVFKATVEQEKPSCAFINIVKHVKTRKQTVKDQDTCSQKPKVPKRDWTGLMSKRQGLGYGYTRKACFVCGSFSHLIRGYDFHEKRMAKQVELNKSKNKVTCKRNDRPVWNSVQRLNHQNKFVSTAILTRTGRFPVNAARQNFSSQAASTSTVRKVNTAKPIVNEIRPRNNMYKSHSPIQRLINKTTTPKAKFSNHKVNTFRDKTVNAVGGNRVTVVKTSADNPHQTLKGKGILDSGCSRHMTRNKTYLVEYQDFNGEPVAFGDTECLVLSPEFKLPAKNQVLLRVPRQNKMYSFNLENIVPSRDLACLIAKATVDESNKWYSRIVERKNRILIEAARTILADLFLPNTFGAELVTAKNKANKTTGPKETNNSASTQENIDAENSKMEAEHVQEYCVLTLWSSYTSTVKRSEAKNGHETLNGNTSSKTTKEPVDQEDQAFLEELESLKDKKRRLMMQLKLLKRLLVKVLRICFFKKELLELTVPTIATGPSYHDLLTYANQDDSQIPGLEDIYEVPNDEIFTSASYDVEVYQMDVKSAFLYGKIDEEVYVSQPLGFIDPKFLKKVYKVVKALYGLHQAPRAWFQVTPKTLHLYAVKRIFRYLKGQSKLGLWYPRESAFDLEAYSDSYYAGVNLKRKSTTGGCQFLGRRLISWQCKKQTIVATLTTEAECVAAVLKIHTDDNVADLLTKAFDVSRFNFLIVNIRCSTYSCINSGEGYIWYLVNAASIGKHLYNMVAYLDKTERNAHFHMTVDFLSRDFNKLDHLVDEGVDYVANEGMSTDKIKVLNTEAEGVSAARETLSTATLAINTASVQPILLKRFKNQEAKMGMKKFFKCWFNHHTTNGHQFTMSNRHQEMISSKAKGFCKKLTSPKQTALGKDFSNSLMADSLPKTIWLSMHRVIAMKHWLFQSKRLQNVKNDKVTNEFKFIKE